MYRKHGQLNMFHKGNKKKLTIVRFDYPCVNKNLTRIYISTKPQINYPILKLYQCCLSGGGATCRKITVHIQKEKTETQLSWTEEYVAWVAKCFLSSSQQIGEEIDLRSFLYKLSVAKCFLSISFFRPFKQKYRDKKNKFSMIWMEKSMTGRYISRALTNEFTKNWDFPTTVRACCLRYLLISI
jgi:hypothetical protein